MNTNGGAIFKAGAGGVNLTRNIMLPITVPAALYGKRIILFNFNVRIKTETENDSISAIILRRQTGLCDSCYENVFFENTLDISFPEDDNPNGGVISPWFNSEVVMDLYGYLYLTLELTFADTDSWIEIGGVTLWYEHE